MAALLTANDLSLLRGDRCLFHDLDFALDRGELLRIEGPNGSGKTSLLRGIAGLLEFATGHVTWDGDGIHEAYQAFRADLVWLSHRVGFKEELNIAENLRFESALRASSPQMTEAVLERLGLSRLTALPFRYLSAGQQRRVALARMLLADAPLWLMDEPFTNLDTAGQALVAELIAEHLASGGLGVVATHHAVDIDVAITRVTLG